MVPHNLTLTPREDRPSVDPHIPNESFELLVSRNIKSISLRVSDANMIVFPSPRHFAKAETSPDL